MSSVRVSARVGQHMLLAHGMTDTAVRRTREIRHAACLPFPSLLCSTHLVGEDPKCRLCWGPEEWHSPPPTWWQRLKRFFGGARGGDDGDR